MPRLASVHRTGEFSCFCVVCLLTSRSFRSHFGFKRSSTDSGADSSTDSITALRLAMSSLTDAMRAAASALEREEAASAVGYGNRSSPYGGGTKGDSKGTSAYDRELLRRCHAAMRRDEEVMTGLKAENKKLNAENSRLMTHNTELRASLEETVRRLQGAIERYS